MAKFVTIFYNEDEIDEIKLYDSKEMLKSYLFQIYENVTYEDGDRPDENISLIEEIVFIDNLYNSTDSKTRFQIFLIDEDKQRLNRLKELHE